MRYILLSLLHSIFTRGKETHDKILLGTCEDPGTGGEDILPVACLCDDNGLQTHFLHSVGADRATEYYSRRVALTWA